MSEPHPFRAIDLARRAERLTEHERRRERRRLALMRPAARAEYDRAMHEPEPPMQVDAQDWLATLATQLLIDGRPISLDELHAEVRFQLRLVDGDTLAERVALLDIRAGALRRLAEALDVETESYDDRA